jgi:hypothetical protein
MRVFLAACAAVNCFFLIPIPMFLRGNAYFIKCVATPYRFPRGSMGTSRKQHGYMLLFSFISPKKLHYPALSPVAHQHCGLRMKKRSTPENDGDLNKGKTGTVTIRQIAKNRSLVIWVSQMARSSIKYRNTLEFR